MSKVNFNFVTEQSGKKYKATLKNKKTEKEMYWNIWIKKITKPAKSINQNDFLNSFLTECEIRNNFYIIHKKNYNAEFNSRSIILISFKNTLDTHKFYLLKLM